MNAESVLKEVNTIFQRELNNENLQVLYQTTAQDVAEWDSLMHILLIVAIEKHFKIKFTSSEIESYKKVGDMCDAILEKIGKQ